MPNHDRGLAAQIKNVCFKCSGTKLCWETTLTGALYQVACYMCAPFKPQPDRIRILSGKPAWIR